MKYQSEKLFVSDLEDLKENLLQAGVGDKNVFIIDQAIGNLYPNFTLEFKRAIVMDVSGEALKTWRGVEELSEKILTMGITKNSKLVVVGGGALIDSAGFVASILLRGIGWWVVPTTLLAQVDASVGGKTAINSVLGKNLIGSFHLPERIYFCGSFLDTLPEDQIESGKGEILKYSMLSPTLSRSILEGEGLKNIVKKCVEIKDEIVGEDLRDNGIRKVLNLGHTLGHALEIYYKIPHGLAVVYGIWLKIKLFRPKQGEHFLELVTKLGIKINQDTLLSFWKNRRLWIRFLEQDKKREDYNQITLIVPSPDSPYFCTQKTTTLKDLLKLEL